VTSLQGSAPNASVNGVNTPHLDVELDTGTTGGDGGFSEDEWSDDEKEFSPEFQAWLDAEWRKTGNSMGFLPNEIIFDPGISHAVVHVCLAVSVYSKGPFLGITAYALAKRMGVTHQALSLNLNKAADLGLLQRMVRNGEAFWRMRWVGYRRSPQKQGELASPEPPEKQGELDAQGELASPHTRTHAVSPVLNSSSGVSVKSRTTKEPPRPLSEDERAKLHAEYDARFGSAKAVDDVIDEALDHEALKKRKTEYLYLRTWLRTEGRHWNEHKAKMAAEKARLKGIETAYASKQPVNPYTTEPAPFLTRSAVDLPPFRDRTHD
jgi:hypothetical protein